MGQVTDGLDLNVRLEGQEQVEGYLTTDFLAALWDERCRQADRYRRENPDDLRGIDFHQHQATAALQAYRFLSTLEEQLGLRLALPVVGRRPTQRSRR